jgi:hypothetical protein
VGAERSRDLEEDINVNTTQRMADRISRVSVYEFCCTGVRREFRTISVGGGLRLNPIADGSPARANKALRELWIWAQSRAWCDLPALSGKSAPGRGENW